MAQDHGMVRGAKPPGRIADSDFAEKTRGKGAEVDTGDAESLSEEVHSLSAQLRERLDELWSLIGGIRGGARRKKDEEDGR